jgi:UDP-N-acetyl-D-glucosamine dehydrogenase
MESTPITPELLESMDAVIIITDHSDYNFAEIVKHSNLVVDTRNATKGIKEHREKIVMA